MARGAEVECHQREDLREEPPYIPLGGGDIVFPFDDPGDYVNFVEVDEETKDDKICPPGKRQRDAVKWFKGSQFGAFMKKAFPNIAFTDEGGLVKLMQGMKQGTISCEILAKLLLLDPPVRRKSSIEDLLNELEESPSVRSWWSEETNELVKKYRWSSLALPSKLDYRNHALRHLIPRYDDGEESIRAGMQGIVVAWLEKELDPGGYAEKAFERLGDDIDGCYTMGSHSFSRATFVQIGKMSCGSYDSTMEDRVKESFLAFLARDGIARNTLLQFPDSMIDDLWHTHSAEINEVFELHIQKLEEQIRRFGLDLENLPEVEPEDLSLD